jgi:hypothetical protein
MAMHNYYFVSALPVLGDLGTPAPMSLADLEEHVAASPRPRALVDVLLLGHDLLEREALAAGEIHEVAPAVLTPAQMRNEEPLPPELAPEGEPAAHRVAADTVWAAYYRRAAAVAQQTGSPFLTAWVGYEVALRNALATARAKALGLEPADYLVAEDLGDPDPEFGLLLSEWAAAATPLAGLQILDEARWAWLIEHEAWFSFGDDELAAYAAKLILLVRWQHLTEARE